MKNADKPMHPLHPNHDGKYSYWDGLIKREYFAAMAMQGLCANPAVSDNANIAKISVSLADELLKQLEK